ncbi:Crossover junction endodeoxyribonuclease RuvC [compost metagenome]
MHAGVDVGPAFEDAGIVHEIARREGIGPVEHDVVVPDDPSCVLRLQSRLPRLDADMGVQRLDPHARRADLRLTESCRVVHDLSLQVVHRDDIVIEQADAADALAVAICHLNRSRFAAVRAGSRPSKGFEALLARAAR